MFVLAVLLTVAAAAMGLIAMNARLALGETASEIINPNSNDLDTVRKRLDRAARLSLYDRTGMAIAIVGVVILLELKWKIFTGETPVAVVSSGIVLASFAGLLVEFAKGFEEAATKRRYRAIARAVKSKPQKVKQFNEDISWLRANKEPEWTNAIERVRRA